MLICSGTMPTFEPLTTKQTNLALCSTIQTGFIDRRIAATRSSSGSSRAGINAAGVAPGARGHPPSGGPARGCCHTEPSCPGTAQREEWALVPAEPFQLGQPWCNCSALVQGWCCRAKTLGLGAAHLGLSPAAPPE